MYHIGHQYQVIGNNVYRIEGDGSWSGTHVWKDELPIEYNKCYIGITPTTCLGIVDGVIGSLDRIIIKGIYMIIGAGGFSSTKVFSGEELLRGVQTLSVDIIKGESPRIHIHAVLLPNLIEYEEEHETSG